MSAARRKARVLTRLRNDLQEVIMKTCAACFAIGFALTSTLRADDWPQWRGPNHDGVSMETGWTSQWSSGGPKQLWKHNVGISCSSVAVVKDRVFTMGNQNDTDTVWCYDAKSGALIWKHSYANPLDPHQFEGGSGATPTVDGDFVFTLSRAGHLFCLNARDGKPVWAKHLVKDLGGKVPTWGYSGSPLVVGELLILDVGAPGGTTMALNKKSGSVVWKSGNGDASYGTVSPFKHDGKDCLASFTAFGLVVSATTDGKELARFPWKTSYDVNAATPIISGDKIFISSGYGKGCALVQFNGNSLKSLWENRKMRNHFNSSVLWKDHLYGFDESKLTCLDFATGNEKWTQDGLGKGSLMIADGKLIIQSERGDLVIAEASPAAFKELARAKVLKDRCWVVPVLANGHIYCKNNNGDLVCLDVAAR
jgi:outer membrane protein assembly factor BamB